MSTTAPGVSPARVLVVGGGGRENALAWALNRSHGVEQVWVSPGNGGTQDLAGCQQLAIAESDHDGMLAACREHAVDLVVVGAADAERLAGSRWHVVARALREGRELHVAG